MYIAREGKRGGRPRMDTWLEEWFDNESAKLREQETRKASWKRTVTKLLRTRMWLGRN